MLAVAQSGGTSREESPHVVGPYRILESLGVNAIDAVYLARVDGPHGLQRRAALRVVDAASAHARGLCDAARTMASLAHPSLVSVLDFGESDGWAWVATEHVVGESAHDILRHAERAAVPVPWSIATRIVADAADALAAMHASRGARGEVVHGSVSPRSLLVTYAGTTKLKAAFLPQPLDARDLAYRPPHGSPLVGARADVYALAAILWELCAGRRLEVWDASARRNVSPLPSLGGGVPESVDVIIQRALGNVAGAPCATARELARALRGALVVEGIVVEEHDVGRYVQSRFAERYAKRGTELVDFDDDRTEVFQFEMTEPAPDTERELPPIADDDDVVEKTMPFRRRAAAPVSFVKAQPVIVIGPAEEVAPPAPLVARAPNTLRIDVSPVAPPRVAPVHAAPVHAVPVYAAPAFVAAPAKKRAPRWPLFAAAALLLGLTGAGLSFARGAHYFDRAARASLTVEPPPVAAPTPTPSTAPSLAIVDLPAMPSVSAPVPSAPVARRPVAFRPPALPPAPPRATTAAPSAAPIDPLSPASLPATGKLTVLCIPGCDQVLDGGRLLGPSPVFKIVTTTGVHHLTLVIADPPMKKQIDVNVVEDETTLVREEMK